MRDGVKTVEISDRALDCQNMMVTRHYLVSGRVQGVGFRAFTYKRARALGLKGKVRNLDDGRVEIIATGPSEKLVEFEDAILKGPMFSKVANVASKTLAKSPTPLSPGSVVGADAEVNADVESAEFTILTDGEKPWSFG